MTKSTLISLAALLIVPTFAGCVADAASVDDPADPIEQTAGETKDLPPAPANESVAHLYAGLDDAAREHLAQSLDLSPAELDGLVAAATPGDGVHLSPATSEREMLVSKASFVQALSSGATCVGIVDALDLCFQASGSGPTFGVTAWIELFGVASPKQYYGSNGVCYAGGLNVAGTGATYRICYLRDPWTATLFASGEACFLGNCDSGAYAKVWVNP